MKNKYIFILCPHYQGSTIILNLLNSSNKVSSFSHVNIVGEGTSLFKKADINDFKVWSSGYDPNYFLDYKKVKEAYDTEWDYSKPILIEKCPMLISRAKEIEEYFSKFGDVYFIISIRSPYSTDRYKNNSWIKAALAQKKNIETLKNKIITTYEQLCLYPEKVIKKIQNRIPELNDLSLEIKIIELKNNKNKKLNDRQYEKIQKIHKDKVYRIIDKESKNKMLNNHKDLLKYFSYEYIE